MCVCQVGLHIINTVIVSSYHVSLVGHFVVVVEIMFSELLRTAEHGTERPVTSFRTPQQNVQQKRHYNEIFSSSETNDSPFRNDDRTLMQ